MCAPHVPPLFTKQKKGFILEYDVTAMLLFFSFFFFTAFKGDLIKTRICMVERIRISYFLALSRMARFYATTEQKSIHSFCNALRIFVGKSTNYTKVRAIHRLYTTQNNPWICRYRFNGKVFLIFSVSPLIHVK